MQKFLHSYARGWHVSANHTAALVLEWNLICMPFAMACEGVRGCFFVALGVIAFF